MTLHRTFLLVPGRTDSTKDTVERFGRGTAADHPEGTGIGLYVSRELCRAMGGSLELEPAVAGAWAEGAHASGGSASGSGASDRAEEMGEPGSNSAGFGAAFTIGLPAEPPAASES